MPLYKLHKIRITLFLILFVFLISLFSVFLLHTDVIGEQSDDQGFQFRFDRPWRGLFGKSEDDSIGNVIVSDKDYGDYGPADIIVDDRAEEYESNGELLDENSVFKTEDFDLKLLLHTTINKNEFLKEHHIPERKLHGDEEMAAPVREFIVPSDVPLTTAKSHLNLSNKSCTEGGVYWSNYLEMLMPKGSDDNFVGRYLHDIQNDKVIRVQPPSWDRCGRPKNQYLTLASGEHVCARYRDPHNYLVLGEVLSFYLSRLLGIHNTPIVTLSHVTSDSPQWSIPSVKHNIKLAGWKMNTTVALIQWIDGLERSRMPPHVLNALIRSETINAETLQRSNLTDKELVELMQWTDLIVFDYIIGHYDRVASMQDAAEKEQRLSILQETVHNLVKSQTNHGLWLIDNESGILDGYTLMYSPSTNPHYYNDKQISDDSGSHFIKFHEEMLNSTCVFRRSTVNRVRWFHQQDNPLQVLINLVTEHEPHFYDSNNILSNNELTSHFKERISNVYNRMKYCGVS